MSGTLASPKTMIASNPTGSYAYFNVSNGATLTVAYVNATDINSYTFIHSIIKPLIRLTY